MALDGESGTVDARLVSLGSAIRTALGERPQSWLSSQVGIDAGQISRIIAGKVPGVSIMQVAKFEQVLGLGPGDLLRAAGFVADDITVSGAVIADPALSEAAKQSLLFAYQAALTVGEEGQQ